MFCPVLPKKDDIRQEKLRYKNGISSLYAKNVPNVVLPVPLSPYNKDAFRHRIRFSVSLFPILSALAIDLYNSSSLSDR